MLTPSARAKALWDWISVAPVDDVRAFMRAVFSEAVARNFATWESLGGEANIDNMFDAFVKRGTEIVAKARRS